MLRRYLYVLLFFVAFTTPALTSETIPTSDIFGPSGFYDAQLSPNGKHIAVILDKGGQRIAVVLKTKSLAVTSILRFDNEQDVTSIQWANNKRLLATLSQQSMRWGDFQVDTGDLFAMNLDGSKRKMIFGYRSANTTIGHHGILHMLPEDPDHIVIQVARWGPKWGSLPEAYTLNINTGSMKKLARGKVRDGNFLTDDKGNIRLNYGRDKDYNPIIYHRQGMSWIPIELVDKTLHNISPMAFIGDSDRLYILGSRGGRPHGMYILDINNGETETVLEPEVANISEVWFAETDNQLTTVYSMPNHERADYLLPEHPEAKIDQALQRAFKGQLIQQLSATEEYTHITIMVSSDTNPGDFYLFDTESMQATHLFSKNQKKYASQMRPMEPIALKARDGLTLHGYFTAPDAERYPLLVLVHGGPNTRDWFGYNSEVQYLVNRGYAVLQINYRGSWGYGSDFSNKGRKEWGGKIQEDIIDAVQWAVSEGRVQRDRICILGTSFGGYAALMAPIRAPGLFQCAIGIAGVYDLPLMYEQGDVPDQLWGDDYLSLALGDDKATLRENSPTHLANKLDLPILIVHGGKDDRAPIEHANKLRNALEENGKTYQWYVEEGEGHGFGAYDNRVKMYDRIVSFLDTHLKTTIVAQ